jgi:Kef-type K+ transport system membrane component KefB
MYYHKRNKSSIVRQKVVPLHLKNQEALLRTLSALLDFIRPVQEPTLIFLIVLLILLLSPILLKKLRTPSIIGLIIAGVIVGPKGIGLLAANREIDLLGSIGLLYIMFLAGLEIDMKDFKANQNRSITFGALTFLVPICTGFIITYYVFDYPFKGALLFASMFSTHTLVSYPIVNRYGLGKNNAVTVAIGGTIITDTAVLLLLTIIAASVHGTLTLGFWIQLVLSLIVFVWFMLRGVPAITKWFFRNMGADINTEYTFILIVVLTAALLAKLAGVEGIIGAFLAGLALNRLIPHDSPLMNRVQFIGNTLFIPFFLVKVGMLVDVKVLFYGTYTIVMMLIVVFIATSTKWMAAFITQKIYGYTKHERNIIFGLSNAHAAAILAVVTVGTELQLFDDSVLNACIMVILISCLISSFVTESAARNMATLEGNNNPTDRDTPERWLVSVANPTTLNQLLVFTDLLRTTQNTETIYALNIVIEDDNSDTTRKILTSNRQLRKNIKEVNLNNAPIQVVSKPDVNIVNGIARAANDLFATAIVIGWNGKVKTVDKLFGSVLERLTERSSKMIVVAKILHAWNNISNINIIVPPNANVEIGFRQWVYNMRNMAKKIPASLTFWGQQTTLDAIVTTLANHNKLDKGIFYHPFDRWDNLSSLIEEGISTQDLVVFVTARPQTISHHSYMYYLPYLVSEQFTTLSFVIVYPQQSAAGLNVRSIR